MKINDKQREIVRGAVEKSVPVTLAETKNRVDLAYMVACATAYITLTGNLKHFKQFLKEFQLDKKPSERMEDERA